MSRRGEGLLKQFSNKAGKARVGSAYPCGYALPTLASRERCWGTTGDRIRLADTDLLVEITRDLTVPGEEAKFGDGRLELQYARQNQRTILAQSRCSIPWHLFPPMYLDSSGCAFTSLVNPSGGFVACDHLIIQAALDRGAHVVLSTPSANRVYRSLSEEARQTVRLSVASGGILEWFPEMTIPFAGSRFVQTMDVRLATGATALIWDSVASGRIARGERWAFASLQNHIQILCFVTSSSVIRPIRPRERRYAERWKESLMVGRAMCWVE